MAMPQRHLGPDHCQWTLWPVDQPRGIVQIIHGMVEHMGRYDHFARFLNTRGFAVCGEDHMGHGGVCPGPRPPRGL